MPKPKIRRYRKMEVNNRIAVSFPPGTKRKLRREAERKNVSIAQVIRSRVAASYKNDNGTPLPWEEE